MKLNRRSLFATIFGTVSIALLSPVLAANDTNVALKKKLEAAIQPFMFEINDDHTRQMITDAVEDVLNKEPVFEYHVVCNRTNNTPYVVDDNRLVVDVVYMKNPKTHYSYLNIEMGPTK